MRKRATGPRRPLRALPAVVLLVTPGVVGCAGADDAVPPSLPSASTGAPSVPPTSALPSLAPDPAPTVDPATARRLGLRALAALKRDDPATTLALIAQGADVNVQDEIADSVFLYAGAEGYPEVVVAALDHGAEVTSTNRFGGTALIPAAEHAHLEVLRILIAAGSPIDHVNDLGWTALGEAVALGSGGQRSLEAVRLLLAAGADPGTRDRFGRTPLENAERLGYVEIARVLRAAR